MPSSLRALDAQDLERQPRGRVDAQRAADRAEGHRQLDAAHEVARPSSATRQVASGP